MPLRGFVCPDGGHEIPLGFCLKECRNRCHPLPVLAAMMSDREPEPGVFHVTEIFNPPQQVYMMRRLDYYVEPEANAYAAFGQGYHRLMELGDERLRSFGIEDTAIRESSFWADIDTPEGKAVLTGRFDRYEPDTRTLWDYKTEKMYSLKKMLAGEWEGVKHPWQLNTYRTYHPLLAECERLMLSVAVKDHGYRDKKAGFKAIHSDIEVPLIEPAVIKEVVRAKLTTLLRLEKGDFVQLPPCDEADLWGGKRCEEYCSVRPYCIQGLAATPKEKEAGKCQSRKRTSS